MKPKQKEYKGFTLHLCWCGMPDMQWMVYWGKCWLASLPTLEEAKRFCDDNPKGTLVDYHRQPTDWEIKWGYGALHYLSVPMSAVMKKDGTIKKWFRHKDGLRYYR